MAISYNKVTLIGRLTRDPDVKMTQTGTQTASFNIAVDRGTKDAAGKNETDFFRVITFNKIAEFVGKYIPKGRLVLVEGSIRINKYVNREGQNKESTEILASSVKFMEGKKDGQNIEVIEPEHIPRSESDNKGLDDVELPDFGDSNEFDSMFANLKSDLSSDNLPKI